MSYFNPKICNTGTRVMEMMANNKDDIIAALEGLRQFMHNFCMNCTETEEKNDLVFRCGECEFADGSGNCMVKVFAKHHAKGVEVPDDFTCMSR